MGVATDEDNFKQIKLEVSESLNNYSFTQQESQSMDQNNKQELTIKRPKYEANFPIAD